MAKIAKRLTLEELKDQLPRLVSRVWEKLSLKEQETLLDLGIKPTTWKFRSDQQRENAVLSALELQKRQDSLPSNKFKARLESEKEALRKVLSEVYQRHQYGPERFWNDLSPKEQELVLNGLTNSILAYGRPFPEAFKEIRDKLEGTKGDANKEELFKSILEAHLSRPFKEPKHYSHYPMPDYLMPYYRGTMKRLSRETGVSIDREKLVNSLIYQGLTEPEARGFVNKVIEQIEKVQMQNLKRRGIPKKKLSKKEHSERIKAGWAKMDPKKREEFRQDKRAYALRRGRHIR